MDSNILPIKQPLIYGYLYYAYPLSIIECYEECKDWFYSNYIQLYSVDDFKRTISFSFFTPGSFLGGFDAVSYPAVPWLEYRAIDKEVLSSCKVDIHDFVCSNIDNGYYVYIADFDDYYLPQRRAYQNSHFAHDILIHGYDKANREYHISGFNERLFYSFTKIDFENFVNAYRYSESHRDYESTDNISLIRLFKKRSDIDYKFDINLVLTLMDEYVNSKNSFNRFREFKNPYSDLRFGLDSYDSLIYYFNLLINQEVNSDLRPLHVLWEHKLCMVNRIKFMQERNYFANMPTLFDDYKRIEQKILLLRNALTKYSRSHDKNANTLHMIINNLNEIRNIEGETINQMIYNLQIG